MLAMVFLIPTSFAWVIWRSYRSAAARAARGEPLAPPGAIRWERDEQP
jgi:hypothetical protein